MRQSGDLKSGQKITEIRIVSIVMIQEPLHVKQPVLPILQFRDI